MISRMRTFLLAMTIASAGCTWQAGRGVATPTVEQPLHLLATSNRVDSTMMWLARIWSAGQGPARCGRTPPPNEVMWFPGGQYCEFLSPQRGQIGFRVDDRGLIRVMTWDRRTDSRAHARSLTDSLDVVLRSRALTPRLCRSDSGYRADLPGMLWESEGMLVHLSWITRGDERPKLLAIAVTDPKEYPHFLCKPFDQAEAE
ncbi:MAG: hypothetical protein M3365_08840 [Gemmatimonadota bacterium]|nr:hypothetical protein [Gemmatimonadota bacterium]